MTWFRRMESPKVKPGAKKETQGGVWTKCNECGVAALQRDVDAHLKTCPHCSAHFRLTARERLTGFLDPDTLQELAKGIKPKDALGFVDTKAYCDRLVQATNKVGEEEAFVLASGRLHGAPIVVGAFEFGFLGGSMGSVVGEKIALGFEVAREREVPFVLFSASGGARMQEGALSLMQMAKTTVALSRFRAVRKPFVSVLTNPTTGGVAASVSLLGDVIIAEPNALIGFAGPRVIEQTIRQKLPEGFQRSEFLLEHGVIDMIASRWELRDRVANLSSLLGASA